jgi:hypothetical protein
MMQNAPKTSNRQLSQQTNLSVGTKHTLHKNLHFYHYYVTAVQELNPADYPRRLHHCNWLVDDKVGNKMSWCAFNAFNIKKNTSNLKFYK